MDALVRERPDGGPRPSRGRRTPRPVDALAREWPDEGTKANSWTAKRHGQWTLWYENGQMESQGDYVDGEQHDQWTQWYENGQMAAQGQFVDGELHGQWTLWHENGQMIDQGYLGGYLGGLLTARNRAHQSWIGPQPPPERPCGRRTDRSALAGWSGAVSPTPPDCEERALELLDEDGRGALEEVRGQWGATAIRAVPRGAEGQRKVDRPSYI